MSKFLFSIYLILKISCLVSAMPSKPSPHNFLQIAKRGYYGWIDPEYEYGGSMADEDWGWKKRSSGSGYNPRSYYYSRNNKESKSYHPYSSASTYYRNPLPTPSPVRSLYNRQYEPSIPLSNRQSYGFHSMADADWGWKKRKRSETADNDYILELLSMKNNKQLDY